TISTRDWSSDVCSSDLVEIPRYLADPEQSVILRNGASVRVRAIRPDDEPRLMALCRRLSPRTVYQRFFSFRRLLGEEAHALTNEIGRASCREGLEVTVV